MRPKNEEPADKEKEWVWVKDRAGNRFMCPISALRDPGKLSREDMARCLNVGKATPKLND
jgi:DNA-binding transcriptional regulator YiaG